MCTRVESPTVSAQTNLEQLLIDETLLPFPDVAEKLGVPVTKVHDYIGAKKLVHYVKDGKKVVPASLLGEDGLVSGVPLGGPIPGDEDGDGDSSAETERLEQERRRT